MRPMKILRHRVGQFPILPSLQMLDDVALDRTLGRPLPVIAHLLQRRFQPRQQLAGFLGGQIGVDVEVLGTIGVPRARFLVRFAGRHRKREQGHQQALGNQARDAPYDQVLHRVSSIHR